MNAKTGRALILMLGPRFGRNRKLRLEIGALKHSGSEELQLEERRLSLARKHEKSSPEIDASYDNG